MIMRHAFQKIGHSVPLSSLAFAISELMDHGNYNPLSLHQMRTSYICRLLARTLGIEGKDFEDVVIAAAIHDIGLIKFSDKKRILEEEEEVVQQHATIGYNILKKSVYTEKIAEYILYHHTPWFVLKNHLPYQKAIFSNIVYLADRVEVLSRKVSPAVSHVQFVKEAVNDMRAHFAPEIVDAFHEISEKPVFWMRLEFFKKESEILFDSHYITRVPTKEIKNLSILLALLIDAKSPFTRTHSMGVAALSRWLGECIGIEGMELEFLEVAGYLHDLGKLAVPEDILNKPSKLTPEEWGLMQSHVFFTYRALEQIPNIFPIHMWAAQHHERLDGKGYPMRLTGTELSIGSRIIAVADVTTALLEKRPYREELPPAKVTEILKDMAKSSLDPRITRLIIDNIDYANYLVREAEETRKEEYHEIGIGSG